MNCSSIYSDLKKYSGKIEGWKITSMETTPAVNDVESKTSFHNEIQTVINEQEMTTIDKIAELIKKPMIPVKDFHGYVYDTGAIAIRCPHGHIHKYFLRDIKDSDGAVKCLTCCAGKKYTKMVRRTVESLLGIPFIIKNEQCEKDITIEFYNPTVNVIISCYKMYGEHHYTLDNSILKIMIRPTTSSKKIREYLHECFLKHIDLFELKIREKLIAEMTFRKRNAGRVFIKEPLPYTPQLAILRTDLDQKHLNIVSTDDLCLENC